MFRNLKDMSVWLEKNAEPSERKNLPAHEASRCIQCGCCTYTCPARRPLVPVFKLFKPRAMAYNRMKQQKEGNK